MRSAGKFEALTRIGFAARGIMYLLIGYLALRAGRSEDGAGILAYLADGSGRLLLAGMAIGFLAYGTWRLMDAWGDSSGRGSDAKAVAVRAGGAVSGILHLLLGIVAAMHAISGDAGGGGNSTERGAALALDLPGGGGMLIVAAVGLLLAGVFQLRKAWTLDFMSRLGGEGSSGSWICWLGRAGFAARGVVFIVIAWSLWRAGRERSSEQAGGLGEALASLPSGLHAAVAAGLFLFGLFSLVEARFRRIDTPRLPDSMRAS